MLRRSRLLLLFEPRGRAGEGRHDPGEHDTHVTATGAVQRRRLDQCDATLATGAHPDPPGADEQRPEEADQGEDDAAQRDALARGLADLDLVPALDAVEAH